MNAKERLQLMKEIMNSKYDLTGVTVYNPDIETVATEQAPGQIVNGYQLLRLILLCEEQIKTLKKACKNMKNLYDHPAEKWEQPAAQNQVG